MTYFAEALQSDVSDIQQGTTAEGVHLGAMAGTVDLVQRVSTGIEVTGDVLRLNPQLPQELERLDMRIRYRGHSLDLRLTRDDAHRARARSRRRADQAGNQRGGVRVRRRQHARFQALQCTTMSTATFQSAETEPYRQRVDEALAALGTDARLGLSEEEARARLERHGRNELTAEKPVPGWRKFLAQFQDVLVILLLVATSISAGLWLYERESALPYEAIAIFAVVLLNAVMGYIQQSRAEEAVAALRQMSAAHANVIRDGARQSIPATEVVPGDIILIEEGDTVPADARLIQSTALQTAEAALTGESLPVSKDIAPITEEVGLGDRHNMIFSGTAATYGRGRAVVVATGMQTQMGRIAGMLKEAPTETTPLQKELDRVGKLLGHHRRRHRRRDDRHDYPRRRRARFLGDLRRAHSRRGAGGRGGAGRLAGGGDRRARPRRAAHGEAQRHRAPSRGGRDARLGERHCLRQDRHADEERNDGARGRHRERARELERHGLRARRRSAARDGGGAIEGALRIELERALAVGDRANNAVLQERDGRWTVQGDPTEGALDRRGAQSRSGG